MTTPDLKPVLETLLFMADAPLSIDRLAGILEEYDRRDIRLALDELRNDYDVPERGVCLAEIAGGYQFRSKPAMSDFLRRLTPAKTFKFSQSALETLAIIAYRQPVTRAEVEYLRGVDSGGVIKTLLEKKLIRIIGKKDIPGKPLIYGTTRDFLEIFSLRDLAGLPTLKEIQQLDDKGIVEEQQELPLVTGTEPADPELQ